MIQESERGQHSAANDEVRKAEETDCHSAGSKIAVKEGTRKRGTLKKGGDPRPRREHRSHVAGTEGARGDDEIAARTRYAPG